MHTITKITWLSIFGVTSFTAGSIITARTMPPCPEAKIRYAPSYVAPKAPELYRDAVQPVDCSKAGLKQALRTLRECRRARHG